MALYARREETQLQTLAQASCPPEELERKRKMREAWRAYRGEFPKPLKVKEGQADDNVLTNRCAPVVEKGASFLFGDTLQIEVMSQQGSDQDTPDKDKTDFLTKVWGDDDKKMLLLNKLDINGGVCGHGFLKMVAPIGRRKYPRLIVLDPGIVRMVTSDEDCELILAYVIEYPTRGDLQKRQILARVDPNRDTSGVGEGNIEDYWTITNYVRKGSSGVWMQVGEAEIWNYPFAPVFGNQNLPSPNESWGTPDLTEDLINMNKILNFVQTNIARIIKYHGHPKTWGKGFRASQLTTGIDEVLIIEAPDGTLQNLEMQSDLTSSQSFADTLRSDMDERSRVPAVALGRLKDMIRGDISGIALALMFQPLIEKTVQKRRLYGTTIREVSRAALVVGGLISIEDYEDNYPVTLHWPELLPVNKTELAQFSLLLQQLGVSDDTLLQILGFDPDEEREKSKAEDAEKVVAYARGQALPPPEEEDEQMPFESRKQEGE